MPPFFDHDHLALRSRARAWAERELFTAAGHESDLEASARGYVRQLAEEGFLRYLVPAAYGGMRERATTDGVRITVAESSDDVRRALPTLEHGRPFEPPK